MDNKLQFERGDELAREVLRLSKNTLLVNLRFLDSALGQFTLLSEPTLSLATDGYFLYYDYHHILQTYKSEKETMTRNYLHSVMHCIFRHMFVSPDIRQDYWDLACDIAIENTINELNIDSCMCSRQLKQSAELEKLKEKIKPFTAEKIYRYYLKKGMSPEQIYTLNLLFKGDDHDVWYVPEENLEGSESDFSDEHNKNNSSSNSESDSQNNENQNNPEENPNNNDSENPQDNPKEDPPEKNENENQNKKNPNPPSSSGKVSANVPPMSKEEIEQNWNDISEKIRMDLETFSQKRGDFAGNLSQSIAALNREKYDYSEFLRKFSVLGESMQINEDEFDYIFYTYGLKLYDKMPLIEPLEYKEVKKIKEFVIAIDTSGSVSGKLVQKFIEKTYNILKQQENFFTKINLRIIQCDAVIQEDTKITSQEDFDDYIENLELHGFGGTDFRPVFTYVDELIHKNEFFNLKGLIYFTDGLGIFPKQKPSYDTAFVFIDDELASPDVPVWAIKLVLQSDEI